MFQGNAALITLRDSRSIQPRASAQDNVQHVCQLHLCLLQVRSLIEVLPYLDVVENDPFNSSPKDPKKMGPEALEKFSKGEELPATQVRTPLVELPLGATEDRICGALNNPFCAAGFMLTSYRRRL